jgi:hypothetical protein
MEIKRIKSPFETTDAHMNIHAKIIADIKHANTSIAKTSIANMRIPSMTGAKISIVNLHVC